MKESEIKKLKSIAKSLNLKNEKIPSDSESLLSFIDEKVNSLKKHDAVHSKEIDSQTKRINNILQVLMAISNLDFEKKASLSKNNDFIDGLAAGVNMMGEELKSSTVSLKEKETLLKEIHHRVKNNLQVVQSLLNIQSTYITDKGSYSKFKESIERVRSMSLIHEKLYLSTDLSQIDFTEYLHSLVGHLFVTYNINPENISVETKFDSAHNKMDLNLAIPCGLMVNEMLTNCFKYAFPKGRKGKIKLSYVSVRISGNNFKNTILVEDDGIGLPKNFKIDQLESLGMQLITTLVDQIDGKLEILKIKGAGLKVSFMSAE